MTMNMFNLNTGTIGCSLPPIFGNSREAEDYQAKVDADEAVQSVEWQVRHLCVVDAIDGTRLTGGMEVQLHHVGGSRNEMGCLVSKGAVCHVADPGVLAARNCPPDARYVVGALAVMGRARVLSPGEPCQASDFGSAADAGRDEVPPRLQQDGTTIPGSPGYAARPGVAGETVLADYISRGLVIDRQAPKGKR